jgi:putative zinc-binding metallo-peptidase
MAAGGGAVWYPEAAMAGFETTPPDLAPLLAQQVSQLGLKLEGSPVERYVHELHRELEAKGLRRFRPPVYLTDEWGCPSEEPIIGIPFYLADPKLVRLEQQIDEVEDAREIRMYLRHEAGHAFNYAYKLYETPAWRELFGPFNRPYRDHYRPVPFDRRFVRHIEGWYAQKHPDEDFAETFAVWLTPRSRWRQRYRGWPAMRKLRYIDRIAREVGDTEPVVRIASTDITVEEMHMTVEEFFRTMQPAVERVDVALENDLPDFFVRGRRRRGVRPAAEFVAEHRADLINKIEYWTGVRRSVVRALVERIEDTVRRLSMAVETAREPAVLIELTTYATTLTMNYLTRGSFVPKARDLPRASGAGRSRPEEPHGHAKDRDRARA